MAAPLRIAGKLNSKVKALRNVVNFTELNREINSVIIHLKNVTYDA